jgi:hypothetical protein
MTGWPWGQAIESDAAEGPCQKFRSRIEYVHGSKRMRSKMRIAKLVRPLDWSFWASEACQEGLRGYD